MLTRTMRPLTVHLYAPGEPADPPIGEPFVRWRDAFGWVVFERPYDALDAAAGLPPDTAAGRRIPIGRCVGPRDLELALSTATILVRQWVDDGSAIDPQDRQRAVAAATVGPRD